MVNSTPGTPTTSGQRKRARTEAERNKSLKCSNAFFHLGIVLTFIGIIFTILAMATNSLFYLDIHKSQSYRIHVPFGIFSSAGYKIYDNGTYESYAEVVKVESDSIKAAQGLVLIGLFSAIIAAIIHILFCIKEAMRKRKIIFIEMIFLLIAMVSVLACLSFCEIFRENVHDDESNAIANFMVDNKEATSAEIYNLDRVKNPEPPSSSAKFTQVMTLMRFSFYALIIATFLFLLAFLFALIYFVRLCERINKEERELRENLTKPERAPVV